MSSADPTNPREFYEKRYPRAARIAFLPPDDDFMYAPVLAQLRGYLGPGRRVLDVGCNTGGLSLYMARAGCEVTGIDIAGNAIELARLTAEHYKVVGARFERKDLGEEWDDLGSFDLVLCSHVIEHVPDDRPFIRRIASVLRPGGHLVLLTPTHYSSLYRACKRLTGRCRFDEEAGHLRRYTRESIATAVEEGGMTVLRVVLLDGALRDWVVNWKPLRPLVKVLARRPLRGWFNRLDCRLAPSLFPASVCVHAQRPTP